MAILSHDDTRSKLRSLHKLLIEPIADLLPKDPDDRVIFIPQQELFLVPFPALLDADGKYLIDKHTILTAPSIQVLDSTHTLRTQLAKKTNGAIVVGNNSAFAPEIKENSRPLESAEKEAVFVADQLKTKAILGQQATKTIVLEKMAQAQYIHLSTHGEFDDARGLGSWIALAPSGQDNGKLTAEEILGMKLNADLVVLSACNTGRGRITGDGVIGLSRSFIAAGVPSVIVSLWSVRDDSTAFLMEKFYQYLPVGKAKALRQAMLETKEKYPNNPEAWAAFTLIGEAE